MSKRVYDDEQKPFSLKIWAKMLPFLKPYGGKILLIVLLMLFNAAVDISYPLFQGYAIDTFIIPQTVEGIWPFAILYFVILTLQSISTVLFCRLALRVEMYLGRDLKRSVFNHLQTLSFSYYNVTPVGTIVARTMSDTNKIGSMFAWSLVDIFWAASFVLGSMVTMLFINWKLALPIIAIVPLIAIILVLLLGRRTGERIYVERSADAGEEGPLGMKMLYICYAFISILASFGFFSWFDVLVLFLAISLAFDRSVFIRADYSLLLSSIFLSAAGASASPLIARILGDGAFWKAVLLSEITGSLPAAAAASGHLGAAELIEAVNIGAFGTLVQLPAVAAFRIVGKNGRKEFALLYTISSAILLIVFITMHIAASCRLAQSPVFTIISY